MLSDFFRINLPYGLIRNENGDWMAFNREYKPLGFNTDKTVETLLSKDAVDVLPVYSNYWGLTNRFIQEITEYDESSVNRDEQGNIWRFWLYNDSSNPMNQREKENEYWDKYWHKLKKIAQLNVLHRNNG